MASALLLVCAVKLFLSCVCQLFNKEFFYLLMNTTVSKQSHIILITDIKWRMHLNNEYSQQDTGHLAQSDQPNGSAEHLYHMHPFVSMVIPIEMHPEQL
jgi:hypothetical protein